MNKAEALRQAKLDYIKSAEGFLGHPAFWSPFVQLGDSRVIELDKKGAGPFAVAIYILVILIGVFMLRPKSSNKLV